MIIFHQNNGPYLPFTIYVPGHILAISSMTLPSSSSVNFAPVMPARFENSRPLSECKMMGGPIYLKIPKKAAISIEKEGHFNRKDREATSMIVIPINDIATSTTRLDFRATG